MVSTTTIARRCTTPRLLWFAWKFVPLWYQQQPYIEYKLTMLRCDLLENSYLCGINNNDQPPCQGREKVVICLKIRTFVVSTTTNRAKKSYRPRVVICLKIRTFVVSTTTVDEKGVSFSLLWFAWKFVPLWYQQQQGASYLSENLCCDLLENSYLCGINNNLIRKLTSSTRVVICLKIRTFVVSTTTEMTLLGSAAGCDLLENSYLCGINNNYASN